MHIHLLGVLWQEGVCVALGGGGSGSGSCIILDIEVQWLYLCSCSDKYAAEFFFLLTMFYGANTITIFWWRYSFLAQISNS